MLRVVIDTSVVVAALRSREGASNVVSRLLATGRIVAVATPALFLEYEEVIKRPEQRSAHGLDGRQLERFLAALASAIEPVTVHIGWRRMTRTPKRSPAAEKSRTLKVTSAIRRMRWFSKLRSTAE